MATNFVLQRGKKKKQSLKNSIDEQRTVLHRQQVLMLISNGYTTRQIAGKLNVSIRKVQAEVVLALNQAKEDAELALEQYKAIQLGICDEISGRLAEWLEELDRSNLDVDVKIMRGLTILDRIGNNQDRVIRLRQLEPAKKIEAQLTGRDGEAFEIKVRAMADEQAALLDSLSRNGYIITNSTQ
ncbi:MAG TPA: hypothetical protein VFO76_10170 [Candidatus Kapabacteria bacterium]|nr:hypothetical protein [Candidatus Kapabacteria bacterium]